MASSPTTASNKSTVVVERTISSQEPLKCPRCDSSNTKFCYYNNYSLSQPRHFCKACKRYWTRGGTLRNVPVGGGCRKNNRVKRPPPPSSAGDAGIPSYLRPRVDLSHSLLYSNLSAADDTMNNPLEFSFPFSGLSTAAKFSSDDHSSGLFDNIQQPRVTDLGIGFSSSSSSSIFNSSNAMFGSSSSAASLLAPTVQQQNYIETRNGTLQDWTPCHEGRKGAQQNGSGWNSNPNPNSNLNPYYNHTSQADNPSDPSSLSSLLWNPSNVSSSGAWSFDPSNNMMMGSSVPSLM